MSLLPLPERPDIDSYYQCDDIYDYVGQGTFATVFKAVCLANVEKAIKDQVVALKVFDRKSLNSEKTLRDLVNEIEILRRVDHPNCARLLDCFQTPYHVVIVMDFVAGKELFQALKEREFSEAMVCSVMQQLLHALAYLHDVLSVVHRDVKPENILVTPRGGGGGDDNEDDDDDDHGWTVTLVDFGLARKFGKTHTAPASTRRLGRVPLVLPPHATASPLTSSTVTRRGAALPQAGSSESLGIDSPLLATPCGTLKYAAPETIKSISQSSQLATTRDLLPRVDVYAAGIIMYIMLCGALPFKDFANKAGLVREMEEGPPFSGPRWANVSPAAIELNRALLMMDPQRRPRAAEALQHAWFHVTAAHATPQPSMAAVAAVQRLPVDAIIGERALVTRAFDAMMAPPERSIAHAVADPLTDATLPTAGGCRATASFATHTDANPLRYFTLPAQKQ